MNESLLVIGSWWKNKTDGRIGYITDMQDKKGLVIIRYTDPSILASETRVGSYCKYDFLRQWEIILDIPVKFDSIWKSNKTGNIVKVLIEPDVSYSSVYYINLNDTTGHQGMSHMDRAAFITEHTFLRDNDNGALYRHNKYPNMYLKVIETTKKQSSLIGIVYVKYSVIEGDSVEDDNESAIATFHSCCHLLSLDPEKDKVPMDNTKTIKSEDEEAKRLKSKYHKIAKELRDVAKECDITIGSIWKEVRGCDPEHVGSLVKVTVIFGDIIKLTRIGYDVKEEGSTCRSLFLYCFEKVQDNDDGAIYRPFDRTHNSEENPYKYQMVKVVETNSSTTPESSFVYGTIKYITIPVSSSVYSVNLEEFHSDFELVSLNPAEVESKLEDETIAPQQVTWDGAIWYHTNGGVHVAITIKEENDVVWYVTSDNNAPGIYWQMPLEEWVKTYTLYEGTVKPSCYPEGSFDKMIEDTKERYERVAKMLKEREDLRNKTGIHYGSIENEPIMENSKETYLKTDESKMKEFSSGAKREDKSGKGRYDLIPGDVMADFVDYAWDTYFNEGPMTICDTDVSLSAYFDDMTNKELFFEFILNMTCLFFTKLEDLDETTDCVGERSYVVTWEAFHEALYEMREALAKHYEAGAKVHGVNNWKKGIPISDSERGGNFVDSMRRHTDQALRGLTDEPHPISAIWNAFAAVWTLSHNHTPIERNEHANEESNFSVKQFCEDNERKRVEVYQWCYTRYNLYKCIELLRSIVKNGKFSKLNPIVSTVYFNIYIIFKTLHRILVMFQEDPEAIKQISNIISDFHSMINLKVGHIEKCCGNIRMTWVDDFPEYLEAFECADSDPDEDEINILCEMIGRTSSMLLCEGKPDYFCGLGITQSLLEFNTDCIMRRINNNKK